MRAREINKGILFIIDGLGDRPLNELNDKTPLEFAETPVMDSLADEGVTGIVDPLSVGMRVGTDVGCLALFGYEPLKSYSGRGPIEAYGVGMELGVGDVALRANFSTVNGEGKLTHRRAGRIREGTDELASALDGMELSDGVEVSFRSGTDHRAVLMLRGRNLSPNISDSDPGVNMVGVPPKEVIPTDRTDNAVRTSGLVNEFLLKARDILKGHPVNKKRIEEGLPPANAIITRGAGIPKVLDTVMEKFNIRGGCVAAESTIIGIGKMAGFNIYTDPSMTGNLDTDISTKMNLVLKALSENDLVICHIKGTDIAAHYGDYRAKTEFIARIDKELGEILREIKVEGVYISISADHSTSCLVREHTADPVPTLLWGYDVMRDDTKSYSERETAKGGLNRISANGLILTLLDYIGATHRFGD